MNATISIGRREIIAIIGFIGALLIGLAGGIYFGISSLLEKQQPQQVSLQAPVAVAMNKNDLLLKDAIKNQKKEFPPVVAPAKREAEFKITKLKSGLYIAKDLDSGCEYIGSMTLNGLVITTERIQANGSPICSPSGSNIAMNEPPKPPMIQMPQAAKPQAARQAATRQTVRPVAQVQRGLPPPPRVVSQAAPQATPVARNSITFADGN